MNKILYEWYSATKKLLKAAHESENAPQDMVEEWENALSRMEQACPDLQRMYEVRAKAQESFTSEQIDHICYMIGEWYVEWKDKMWVDGKPNQHRLGIAKEELKLMICGE